MNYYFTNHTNNVSFPLCKKSENNFLVYLANRKSKFYKPSLIAIKIYPLGDISIDVKLNLLSTGSVFDLLLKINNIELVDIESK